LAHFPTPSLRDVGKAKKMLEATLKWRADSGVERITYGQVAAEAATGKMTRLKIRDRTGRPVLLMRPRFENTKLADGQIRFLSWNMLALTRCMVDDFPRGQGADLAAEQLTLVIDFKGYSVWNAPPTKTSMETLSILQNHFPERLGSAVLLNPPRLFSVLWAMIGPFLDARTVAKIHFIDLSAPKGKEELAKSFDPALLHTSLGGSCETPAAAGYLPWDAAEYDAWAAAEEAAYLERTNSVPQ